MEDCFAAVQVSSLFGTIAYRDRYRESGTETSILPVFVFDSVRIACVFEEGSILLL